MKLMQLLQVHGQWTTIRDDGLSKASLILCFAASALCRAGTLYQQIRTMFPQGDIVICSTGGEILDEEVFDQSIAVTAIEFESSQIQVAKTDIQSPEQSCQAANHLASQLKIEGLRLVWLISDGLLVNGSELIKGCRQVLPDSVLLTGGLAGDGADFQQTFTALNAEPTSGQLIAIGFYGDHLQLSCASYGGWDRFGPERKVTRSEGNILYELDHQPALTLYKQYLGDEAEKLPSSALLFPLTIRAPGQHESSVVRTILAIDEQNNSMTFAGDLPQGYTAQLMRGNFDHLVEGAANAASQAKITGVQPALALLVSCIGRKLLMGQRIADEVEAVSETLGTSVALTGFYSYGEIAPDTQSKRCELHNQTMTITLIGEAIDNA